MRERIFKTSEVLAEMHSFPMILAARQGRGILEVFDEMREVSPRMAGIEDMKTDYLSWSKLSRALSPVLKQIFFEMAREEFPDAHYWSDPGKTIDVEKAFRLGAWVKRMENKFGETQEVIDISEEVRRRMELDAYKPPESDRFLSL